MARILANLLLMLAVSATMVTGLALPLSNDRQQDDSSSNNHHLLNLSEEEAYSLLKDSLQGEEENQGGRLSEEPLTTNSRLYADSNSAKSDDEKRKFSAWAGKRTEVAIPWGDILRVNSGPSGGEIYRRGFNPWAGKRAFQPWAGKRSLEDLEEMEDKEQKRGFKPWAGKRSEPTSDKRGFQPWAGKREAGLYGETQEDQLDGLAEYMEKRKNSFSPWKGKRARPSGKRVFNPWAGK